MIDILADKKLDSAQDFIERTWTVYWATEQKRASADTQLGIDRGSWLVFSAFR